MIERYVARLASDRVAIFLFHGVITTIRHRVRNYTRKHLPSDYFDQVLSALLEAGGKPVSMDEIAECTIAERPLPQRAFAVTFDDGFENNWSVAAPILEKRAVPATFYVTSGFIEANSSSWTDLLEEAMESAGVVALKDWGPTIDGRYETAEDKRRVLEAMRAYVKAAVDVDPYEFAERLRSSIGAREMILDPELDQKMTWLQVAELDGHPLFTVGGHSHTHRVMSFLDPESLEREVETSIDHLERRIGHAIRHYSYPEGLEHCYSPAVIESLQRHGIVCSPTAIDGTNRPGDNLFHLKRITVV
jgi:peptidoglycan/xylan/chitin deacetylase (PgdA/CDA1 family)